jgi:hypothetical protein
MPVIYILSISLFIMILVLCLMRRKTSCLLCWNKTEFEYILNKYDLDHNEYSDYLISVYNGIDIIWPKIYCANNTTTHPEIPCKIFTEKLSKYNKIVSLCTAGLGYGNVLLGDTVQISNIEFNNKCYSMYNIIISDLKQSDMMFSKLYSVSGSLQNIRTICDSEKIVILSTNNYFLLPEWFPNKNTKIVALAGITDYDQGTKGRQEYDKNYISIADKLVSSGLKVLRQF